MNISNHLQGSCASIRLTRSCERNVKYAGYKKNNFINNLLNIFLWPSQDIVPCIWLLIYWQIYVFYFLQ